MKKKLICGILALGMCFSFASCDKINGILGGILGGDSSENTPLTSSSAEEVNLEEIKEYAELTIRSILSKTSNREDYTLPNTLSYDVYTYNLSWSVNVTEGVQLVKKENGTLVDVDETLSEELKYTLTVTITDSADASKSITTTFNRKVEAAPTLVPLPITKDPVVGTAYKYHIYHAQAQTDYYMTGKIYKTYDYYFDISTKMEDAVDVFVEAVEGESGKFYMYHNGPDGNAKKYINARKTADGKHISNYFEDTAETKWFFDPEVGTMVTVINNLKGVDAKYYVGCDTDPSHRSLSPQPASESGNKGYLIEMVDRTQATVDQKLEQTAKELSLDVVYVGAGSLDLAKQGTTYPDVTVAWAVKSGDIATIADYKLTVANAPTATSEVVVTATATVDGKSVEKEFTVKFIPNERIAILDALDGLKSGESFANKVTLTGIVSAFDEDGAYNEQYGNISITMMVVYNETYKEVGCFRLNGVGVENVGIGDTITVEGILTNHGGYAKQFGAGSTMTNRVDGEPSNVPGAGETPSMTPAEIVDAAYALKDGESLSGKYTLTGVISSVDDAFSSQHNNVTVTIKVEGKEDKPIQCFRLKGTGADEIKVGDTITVTGTLKNFNGKIEFDTGCTLDSFVPGTGEGGETGGETGATKVPQAVDMSTVAENTPYKLVINQTGANKTLYILNEDSGYYTASTEDYTAAPDVYVEIVTGGYHIYILENTTKTYLNAEQSGTHYNLTRSTTASNVWSWDSEKGTFVTTAGDSQVTLGTYGSYTTFSVSKIDKFGTTSYSAYLAVMVDGETGGEGGSETPAEPETPTMTPAEIVDAAFALDKDTSLDGSYTLTGVVIMINNSYSEENKNVTVTIKVEGKEDKPIQCFRLKGTGADVIKVGDTITVTGTLKNYNGTIEFDTGCTLDSYVAGEPVADPEGTLVLSFTNKDNRTSISKNAQVWEQNGVKLTNDKGSSSTDVGNYSSPARFYKSSNATVECAGMKKIEFFCDAINYVPELQKSIAEDENITVTVSGLTVIVEFKTPVDSFAISSFASQVRLNCLKVTK